MADSDNSTTLPLVTCLTKRSSDAAARLHGDASPVGGQDQPDPAIVLAWKWYNAQARRLALCRRQQQLENRLIRRAGPRPFPDQPARAARLTDAADTPPQPRAQQLDRAYSQARAAEDRAAQVAEQLLEELARTPAGSLQGVMAKLQVLLEECKTRDDPTEFPWPQIGSVLDDLQRLTRLDSGSRPDRQHRRQTAASSPGSSDARHPVRE